MQTKLTLRLDKELIQSAKQYASHTGKSLSQMVADYFTLITREEPPQIEALPPITRSLRGLLKDADISIEDYRRHLEEKHL
ncbi:MAG TPA: antitoxin [Anaerolineae bacterium]|nr:antitoxin [Anaerolineae bacterium]